MQTARKDQSLASLIDLGIMGHFPLFHPDWLEAMKLDKLIPLTKGEKNLAENVLERLSKHKSLDRKQTILFSLPEEDRKTFVRAFIKLVETKILDKGPEIH